MFYLRANGKDKTDLNDAIPVLTTVSANKANEAKKFDEKYHIVSETPNTIGPGLTVVSKTATKPVH